VTRCPFDETELVRVGATVDPLLGRTIGGFTLRRRLGAGGMGAVYLAWQHSVGREVAVKVIGDRVVRDFAVVRRFLREAKLASRLSHPHVVTIHDFGQSEDGLLYLVMELLDGPTLHEILRRDKVVPPARAVAVAIQLCDALEAAHALSVIHRDLKPSNVVLLDRGGGRDFVKVLDFGIAKSLSEDDASTTLTHSDQVVGTPAYMAPESSVDGRADARSDLYSLGVMLYRMLAGKLPFESRDVRTLISMHADQPPPPLTGVPAPITAVVERLLAKAPEARFASAAATRVALEEALRAPAEPERPPVTALPRGRRRLAAAVALLVVAGAALLAWMLAHRGAATPDRAAAPADAGAPLSAPPPIGGSTAPVDASVATPPVRDAAPPPDARRRKPPHPARHPDAGPGFLNP
ncbi:MAG TPA: protein kinase, partial [Kofleriaceae bacterium]|nr:protein kinase [Kofleriaceae bacterium]